MDRLATGALLGLGMLGAGAVLHSYVSSLPSAWVTWARPAALVAAGALAVVEAYRFGRWGAQTATLFRWTRPVAGLSMLAAVLVLRLLPEEAAIGIFGWAGTLLGVVGATLLVDLARAHRARRVSRPLGLGLGAGALGLLLLGVLVGAADVRANRTWLRIFVATLPLLVIGAAAAVRLRRAGNPAPAVDA